MSMLRNVSLLIMLVAVAVGVIYMVDPTLGGLMKARNEGFAVLPPPSWNGENAGLNENGAANAEDVNENAHNLGGDASSANNFSNMPALVGANAANSNAKVTEGFADLSPADMPFPAADKPANCYPKNQLAPQELLPNDPNSKWAQVNPMAAGDIAGKNFLNAGALVGVNTVGQSLKNASWDLRSEPPNPQVTVSPWLQSTYSPDLTRRPLEIA